MTSRIEAVVSAVFVVAGVILLITGLGGGGFDFRTGEWYMNTRTTPTENRVVGALLIAFGILLARLRSE